MAGEWDFVSASVAYLEDLSTTKIAYKCGFRTRTSLFRLFKRETGLTPREFRDSNSRARSE